MIKTSSYLKLLIYIIQIIQTKGACSKKDLIGGGFYTSGWLSVLFKNSFLLDQKILDLKRKNQWKKTLY